MQLEIKFTTSKNNFNHSAIIGDIKRKEKQVFMFQSSMYSSDLLWQTKLVKSALPSKLVI